MDPKLKDVLIVVAHSSEAEAAEKAVKASGCDSHVLTTGVGGMAMSWALQKKLSEGILPELVINAGIAGSYIDSIKPGDVVLPVTDCFADMGVDDNGSFISMFNANLADPDKWPFSNGRINYADRWTKIFSGRFKPVSAATVNMTSGSEAVIDRIQKAWNPDIETMEGAWFAYTCAMNRTDYFAVRAISNVVEPRNRKNWDIPLALSRLEVALTEILDLIRTK